MRMSRLLRRQSRCHHPDTIVVRSVGIQRTICEHCGNISVLFLDDRLPDVDDTRPKELTTTAP